MAHGGYIRRTFSTDVTIPAGGTAEGAARCNPEGDSFSTQASSGGAYFPGSSAASGDGVVATYPAISSDVGVRIARDDDYGANAWFARATNTSGAPKTLRIFVSCFGAGP
jgi:hypothetical protein